MPTTRGVLAIVVVLLMLGALVALRRERNAVAAWLLTAGTAGATVWSLLSVAWADAHPSALRPAEYLGLAAMAAVFTLYFGIKAVNEEPLV